jgi:nucleotide-binding universal stress UspA family protein
VKTVLGESLRRSFESDIAPETLFTIASDAWREIARVARAHDCETVLVGLPDLSEPGIEASLERLLAEVQSDAVIVRVPHRWRMEEASRVLVPVAGRGEHSHLRARLLASLSRSADRSLTFFHVMEPAAADAERKRVERDMRGLARDEAAGPYAVEIGTSGAPIDAIVARAAEADLVILGVQRRERGSRPLGELATAIAQRTTVPLILISRRPQRSLADIAPPGLLAPRSDEGR